MQYPMVTDVGSELGRPDDGTDSTGFFNDEFYVGLKPYGDASWTTSSIHNKAELTADLQKKFDAFPGVIFNFTQPAEDAVDEALTGLKSALAVKVYGPDLNVLQQTALEIKDRLANVPGFTELTVVRELGQPSLLVDIDRDKIARYGINVADVETVVQTAVGGQAATQVVQGEKLFDLVVRMKEQFREGPQAIGDLLVGTPVSYTHLDVYKRQVAAGSIEKAIAVPDAAILRDDENQPFVYVERGTNQFGRRPVEIGQSQNGETQVTSGLAAGDRVVGDGSLFLEFANSFQH